MIDNDKLKQIVMWVGVGIITLTFAFAIWAFFIRTPKPTDFPEGGVVIDPFGPLAPHHMDAGAPKDAGKG
jgi:hypothetical protein